ncbi:hypothetical protein N8V28_25050 [Enterobacter hormaechei subsp. hoffmannii]|nr:hypothetical protein [Enterobacter hormaechei subsp. hoffmannii]
MEIEINCCNNIDKANITLAEKKLNIKFAPNGTVKKHHFPRDSVYGKRG